MATSTTTTTSKTSTKTETAPFAPFAGFTFDKSSNATTTTTITSANVTSSPFVNLFSNLAKSVESPFNTANLPSFSLGNTVTTTSTSSSMASAIAPPSVTFTTPQITTVLSTGNDTNNSNKLNVSDAEDDYVPTAQFNPVIPLPDLVEVATGEENEIVLFEHRAQLLRHDKEASEWKERGKGNIKLLQDKDSVEKVRLVMRREQVHKLCCNQRLYKDTKFDFAKNSKTALTWAGCDYSEGELTTELLTVRFKTPEICQRFLDAVLEAQSKLKNAVVSSKDDSDKVESCTEDEDNYDDGEEEEEEEWEDEFAENKISNPINLPAKGFGDAFKPKPGTWTCNVCYSQSSALDNYCVVCNEPKDDTVPKKDQTNSVLNTTLSKGPFSFGFPLKQTVANSEKLTFGASNTGSISTTSTISTPVVSTLTGHSLKTNDFGFGDKFKPKPGSWNCDTCLVSNLPDALCCSACETPKNNTQLTNKEQNKNNPLALPPTAPKFNFGFPVADPKTTKVTSIAPTTTITSKTTATNKIAESTAGFSFANNLSTPFTNIKSGVSTHSFDNIATKSAGGDITKSFNFTPANLSKPTFTFKMPTSEITTTTTTTTGNIAAPFVLDKKEFTFTLKANSSSNHSGEIGAGGDGQVELSTGLSGVDDDSNTEYHEEEENNTYFTPVISLPDKIEVKTGEEDEEVLFVHRAKLYRFDGEDKEWKERGLGDVKILRHIQSKKLRVVMRRDRVLKICLNHFLNDDIQYKQKDEKTWLFMVHDFDNVTCEAEKFSLRFINKEIANNFMTAVKSAIEGTAKPIESKTEPTDSQAITEKFDKTKIDSQSSSSLTPPEEGAIADTNHQLCKGCRGCNENFNLPISATESSLIHEDDLRNPLEPLEMPALEIPASTSPPLNGRSLLKQSVFVAKDLTPPTSKPCSSIFSSANPITSNVFNGTGQKSPFSFAAAADKFGVDVKSANAGLSSGFLFGNSNNEFRSGNAVFDKNKTNIFGQTPSIFAKDTDRNSNLPDNKNYTSISTTKTDKNTSIFSGSGKQSFFGNIALGKPGETEKKPIFENINTGNAMASDSIFGGGLTSFTSLSDNKTSIGFGAPSLSGTAKKSETTNAGGNNVASTLFVDISKNAGVVDFASLAAKANEVESRNPAGKPGPGGFIGLVNENAFSSFLKPNNNNDNKNVFKKASNKETNDCGVDDDKNIEQDDNYDPHYEPIIALPKEIVVTLGEESETKLFGERAVLFRYDDNTKEWKERGIGELKVLQHIEKGTYRVVMRREQIHKLVLNHAIDSQFKLNPMVNNPKSYVWATMNFAEDTNGTYEKFAVRFKTAELATKFNELIMDCVASAKKLEEVKENH